MGMKLWDYTEIQVFLATDKEYSYGTAGNNHPPPSCYNNRVAEVRVYRPFLFESIERSSSVIAVISNLLSELGFHKILPCEILKSRSFLRGFAHLMLVLPKDCDRVYLFIWQEIIKSNEFSDDTTWIQHFEIAIDEEPQVEENTNNDNRIRFLDHLFHFFVDDEKGPFESLTVLSHEDHQYSIEPNGARWEILKANNHTKLGLRQEDCCGICLDDLSIKNKAYLTPCLHMYHPHCLFKWIESGKTTKVCPTCRFDLSALTIDFSDYQIWTFKYMPKQASGFDCEDSGCEDFECEEGGYCGFAAAIKTCGMLGIRN